MLKLDKITKRYKTKSGLLNALETIDLHVEKGEFLVIRGHSGSGKTTLLLTVGGMLRPSQGCVLMDGKDLYTMSDPERARYRAENIGFVFQMFHLVPYLNVLENVMLPAGSGISRAKPEEAKSMLDRLHLSERIHHTPSELSAGEKQRTALARAMLNHPKIILADEPTGNLDPDNAAEAMDYLKEYHKEGGTVLVVTHGVIADSYADRIIHLSKGCIQN